METPSYASKGKEADLNTNQFEQVQQVEDADETKRQFRLIKRGQSKKA